VFQDYHNLGKKNLRSKLGGSTMKKRILSFVLALAIVLPSAVIPAFAASSGQMTKQKETEHFEFAAMDQDKDAVEDLAKALEDCYERVTADLKKTPTGKTIVEVYPDLASYHRAIGQPNAPDWSVGQYTSSDGRIRMVSPNNPGPSHDYEGMLEVAVHEYVHRIVDLFGRRQPIYLNEGIAAYEAGQGQNVGAFVKDQMPKNKVPSLSLLEKYNSNSEGLYQYGYAYIHFVTESYGFDKVISLLEGKSRTQVFGKDEQTINREWWDFLANEYVRPATAPNIDTADDWAKSEIISAVKKGFVPTELQNNYKNVITREQFCQMAVMYLEYATGKEIDTILSEKGLTIDPDVFVDTKNEYILAAYALGITNGSGKNEAGADVFAPKGSITREMAATMLTRLSKILGKDTENAADAGYTDINEASDWAVNSINFCYANSVMNGTSQTPLKFSPKETYTIQQSIATFDRMK